MHTGWKGPDTVSPGFGLKRAGVRDRLSDTFAQIRCYSTRSRDRRSYAGRGRRAAEWQTLRAGATFAVPRGRRLIGVSQRGNQMLLPNSPGCEQRSATRVFQALDSPRSHQHGRQSHSPLCALPNMHRAGLYQQEKYESCHTLTRRYQVMLSRLDALTFHADRITPVACLARQRVLPNRNWHWHMGDGTCSESDSELSKPPTPTTNNQQPHQERVCST
ncbi:hypothetical protein F5Y15DRAFT_87717 [Xylariaceae sp. FL0016]|nr:hypothetical protein F5Y15DRAFT_87717 [Xylariaceae sp. FL0016]